MKKPSPHPFEQLRLSTLQKFRILDTEPEKIFDEITSLVAQICETPIALISLVDEKRQWFKAKYGIELDESPRETSFCGHAILETSLFTVENAPQDYRFHDNPLVTGEPFIRFYAGAQIKSPDGMPLGTLCVIDQIPKVLSEKQRKALETLAGQVSLILDYRMTLIELWESERKIEKLRKLQSFCSSCDNIRTKDDKWISLDEFISTCPSYSANNDDCPQCILKKNTDSTK